MKSRAPNPKKATEDFPSRMPVLFIGHGNPMNAIENNEFTDGWRRVAQTLPKPRAILCISAHWETWGTLATAMDRPRTIHDFGGFPEALYAVQYPAPGSPELAQETIAAVEHVRVNPDRDWGLDHGCWGVLKRMYPRADVPVVQLSLDSAKSPQEHYDLGRELAALRRSGVLILSSGNIVHNLGRVVLRGRGSDSFNEPFGLDWALEASDLLKRLIEDDDHRALIEYPSLGRSVQLAVPTPEHYLPLLYALALKEEDESIAFFNDAPVAGSLTMTSLVIDEAS